MLGVRFLSAEDRRNLNGFFSYFTRLMWFGAFNVNVVVLFFKLGLMENVAFKGTSSALDDGV